MVEFTGLAIVVGMAALGGILARSIKQPVVLGYVLAGVLLSSKWPVEGFVSILGQLGVTLLLFLVGLELPISEVKKMGRVALATGLGQIVFTTAIGWLIVVGMGYTSTVAIYLSLALAFSSTIVVVKLLSEKGDLQSLYGKVAIGFLLIQDFVAMGILVVLSGVSSGGWGGENLFLAMIKGLIMVGITLWASVKLVPRVLGYLAESTETVFITSIAWCLGIAALVSSKWVGFGVEIGGFLAGLAMANSIEKPQILSRAKPLRDFFLMIFFVWLGTGLSWQNMGGIWIESILLSAFVIVGNPMIVMFIMGLMGFSKRIAFLSGLTVAQISEFSLIVISLAVRVGHVPSEILTLTTLVGVITMIVSSYMILNGEKLFQMVGKYIPYFENKSVHGVRQIGKKITREHIVLFGHNRTGTAVRNALEELGNKLIVVDFDPSVIEVLENSGIEAVYGDMGDYDLCDELNLNEAKMVLSTVSDLNDSKTLLSRLAKCRDDQVVVMTANDMGDADQLYKLGADYVLLPHKVGGDFLAHAISTHGINKKYLQGLRRI